MAEEYAKRQLLLANDYFFGKNRDQSIRTLLSVSKL